jgi:hypothetical protein
VSFTLQSIQICTCGREHGDIEWLCTIDLEDLTVTMK